MYVLCFLKLAMKINNDKNTYFSVSSWLILRMASANTSGVLMTVLGVPSLSVTNALIAVAGHKDEIDTPK
jgi:hypothetical protein